MDYPTWKKNTPYNYYQIQTSSLLWPSLAIDWLPNTGKTASRNDYSSNKDVINNNNTTTTANNISHVEKLAISTFSNNVNSIESLLLVNANIIDLNSNNSSNLQNFDYSIDKEEFNYSLPLPHLKNTKELHKIDTDVLIDEPEIKTVTNSIGLQQRIPHNGDINRIKHCPLHSDLLATSSDSGLVRIFDRTRKPNNFNIKDLTNDNDNNNNSDNNNDNNNISDNNNDTTTIETCDILLKYHTSESWTLDWNPNKFTIATAANDGIIAIWDLQSQFYPPPKKKFSTLTTNQTCTLTEPILNIPAHNYGVNEIKWIPDHNSLIASVGEDGKCTIWDIRNPSSSQRVKEFINKEPLNTVDINPFNTLQLVSGSSNGLINIFDVRNDSIPIINSTQHKDSITATKYSSNKSNLLVSSSVDSTVVLWNTEDLTPIFVHGGHLLPVNDVTWAPDMDVPTLASCSNDNSIHIWQPILPI